MVKSPDSTAANSAAVSGWIGLKAATWRSAAVTGWHRASSSALASPVSGTRALARIGGWRKEIKPSTLVKQALAGAFVHFAPLPLLRIDTAISVEKRECTDHQIASGQSGGLNVLSGLTFPSS